MMRSAQPSIPSTRSRFRRCGVATRLRISTIIPRRRSSRWLRTTHLFAIVTDPDGPGQGGPLPPLVVLTPEDQADIVAFLKLL